MISLAQNFVNKREYGRINGKNKNFYESRMIMTDCIFCKIVNDELPARKVYEDDKVVAIMDLSQVTPGHTLVITKKHVRNIFEYDEELASEVFARVPKIAKAVKNHHPDVEGLNILMNNEAVASQTVFHSHIHLLPRYSKEDDFGLQWADNSGKYADTELDKTKESLISALKEETN